MSAKRSYFAVDALGDFVRDLFVAQGLSETDARWVADCLIQANVRGVDSHGVARVPIYLERLRRGVVEAKPEIKVERVTPVCASVDGANGMGFVVARRAMGEAIAMAKDFGLGLASAKRSTHYGMAASYVLQAIDAGMIGFVFTNASKAMPVWGGRAAFLGTNPFAAGAPGGKRGPFVLDMATTVTARGKLRFAGQRGEPIAPGLALDKDGRPTTDGMAAFHGMVLPMAGAKGSGLSMLMEILGGVLSGAAFAGDVANLFTDFSRPQNVGHFFMAFRPDLFMPRAAYDERMDTLFERAKATPKAEGFDEILMAGEPEARAEAKRRIEGIPLSADVVAELGDEAAKASLALPPSAPDARRKPA